MRFVFVSLSYILKGEEKRGRSPTDPLTHTLERKTRKKGTLECKKPVQKSKFSDVKNVKEKSLLTSKIRK